MMSALFESREFRPKHIVGNVPSPRAMCHFLKTRMSGLPGPPSAVFQHSPKTVARQEHGFWPDCISHGYAISLSPPPSPLPLPPPSFFKIETLNFGTLLSNTGGMEHPISILLEVTLCYGHYADHCAQF